MQLVRARRALTPPTSLQNKNQHPVAAPFTSSSTRTTRNPRTARSRPAPAAHATHQPCRELCRDAPRAALLLVAPVRRCTHAPHPGKLCRTSSFRPVSPPRCSCPLVTLCVVVLCPDPSRLTPSLCTRRTATGEPKQLCPFRAVVQSHQGTAAVSWLPWLGEHAPAAPLPSARGSHPLPLLHRWTAAW